MAPHLARTLEELRDATQPRLSDHAPLTVSLPINDTCQDGSCLGDPAKDSREGTENVSWEEEYGQ